MPFVWFLQLPYGEAMTKIGKERPTMMGYIWTCSVIVIIDLCLVVSHVYFMYRSKMRIRYGAQRYEDANTTWKYSIAVFNIIYSLRTDIFSKNPIKLVYAMYIINGYVRGVIPIIVISSWIFKCIFSAPTYLLGAKKNEVGQEPSEAKTEKKEDIESQ
jgi:hypothetical protein